jgi:4-hydroxy-tetrahydrodipicolinate synthase
MNKKPEWFKGIFPALVTPFDSADRIDETAYRTLIQHVLPYVHGLVTCGTTGEFSSMSFEEKQRAVSIAVDEAAGRVPVVAGTGCPSTRETIELTRRCKEAGAMATLLVAPYYLKPSFNEVFDHFKAVDAVGLPIILYNIPQCAGTHFRWWTAEGMALALDNVIGIKDSSGDMPFLMALFEKLGDKIGIFCGHDEIAGAAMLAGADGAILASANVIPGIWKEIYEAAQRSDVDYVRKRHREIQILTRIIVRKGSVQAVKEGLGMMGIDVGNGRHPIMPGGAFEREDREDLRTQLEDMGLISSAAANITSAQPSDWTLLVGEGFAGPPLSEIAHIDLLIGNSDGPVGRATERALAEPRPGHELAIIHDRPRTLLVPTVTVRSQKTRQLVYEEAAAGVSLAIDHAISRGTLPEERLDELCLIANVFVHPAASIPRRVRINNYKAMRGAIRKAVENRPTLQELIAEKHAARHPFRYAP